MRTREEYNDALDIIEEYQAQIFDNHKKLIDNSDKTNILKWDKLTICSTRLYNNLITLNRYADDVDKVFIEDIRKAGFMRVRHAGKASWTEFVELRGY